MNPTDDKSRAKTALQLHRQYHGKMQTMPRCPIRGLEDFSNWYTPGVAAPCREIEKDPALAYEFTNKGNTIAIVTDGSRVLGLGDIGPLAGLPVMEGKALLFKYLGGVDAVPICLDSRNTEEFVNIVKALQPSFGAINLEDIAQPKCFDILEALRDELTIPVWHDDQQGTATVLLAGLTNALKVTGKHLHLIKIVMFGMGAANIAVYELLKASGVNPENIVACDSKGLLHSDRRDIAQRRDEFHRKWQVCGETNPDKLQVDIGLAFDQADVVIAFSQPEPGTIRSEWIKRMASDPVVFACANPQPEIWPEEAKCAGAVIAATGRSDFPNQVNNSLCFPGVFRGVLSVRANAITNEMAIAAADELANVAESKGLSIDYILPRMNEWDAHARVAVVTAQTAVKQGIASRDIADVELIKEIEAIMTNARKSTQVLMDAGLF